MSTHQSVTVVPKLPPSDAALPSYAQAMHDAFVDNPDFKTLSTPLTVFAQAIAECREAQASVRTTRGGAMLRRAKAKVLRQIVWHYRDDVQRVVETMVNPHEAAAKAQRVGMDIRKAMTRAKATTSARCTGVSGCVEVDAKSVGSGAVYFWQYSLDQVTWTSLPESFRVKQVITGLTRGQVYYFRFRAHTRKGPVDFCQPVSLVVA